MIVLTLSRTIQSSTLGGSRHVRLRITKMTTDARTSSLALLAPLTCMSNPDVKIPKLLYGTAWKKDRTADLVYQAIKAGFRGIDTAAQPRHYQEDLVGEGISRAIRDGVVKRSELYIQTKYTPPSGQDAKNMPYDASQPIPDQIRASVASSLSHFTFPGSGEPYIDCLLLHSPLQTSQKTNLAWQALEAYVPTTIRSLGISNVTLPALQSLHERMDIKPSVVQNRFYPDTRWEVPLREFCTEKGIAFESFWTLTGNPGLMGSGVVKEVAQELARFNISDPKPIALYALVLGLEGVSVLNGTTKEERMGNDLVSLSMFEKLIEGDWKENWERWQKEFKELIGET